MNNLGESIMKADHARAFFADKAAKRGRKARRFAAAKKTAQ
jgi:hypothetical protein